MPEGVSTLGTGVDAAVQRIGNTYEVRGMLASTTSYDNPTVGSGSALNEVAFTYNEFGQLVSEAQSHSGAVTMSTPVVGYEYADGSANTIRPTGPVYPNGRLLSYGSTNSIDDASSRIASLVDDDVGFTHLVDYQYLGRNTFVTADDTEPEVKWTLVSLTGSDDPDTGDIYTGLDRFGRVKDCRWYNYNTLVDAARIQYGYDRASNRIWRKDPVAEAYGAKFDELYDYDAIQRLKDMARGTLNTGETALTDETFAQCWSLDTTGNWKGFREDDTGDGTWDLVQNRSANEVNEITGIDNTTGPTWATPAYNRAGNMTTIPQPADPSNSYTATYDAWNRLVQVVDTASSDTVSEYAYDGRKRRIEQLAYAGGILDETRHFYFNDDWQCLEERSGSLTDAERQFVWGLRYIDNILLRDRDTTEDGAMDERLYGLQDGNWNVAAICESSGLAQERFAYAAFGAPVFLTGTFDSRSNSSYVWDTLYSGYHFEAITEMFYVRHREYQPALGNWLRRDPLGLIAGVNLYEYAKSNGINVVDPNGLQAGNLAGGALTALADAIAIALGITLSEAILIIIALIAAGWLIWQIAQWVRELCRRKKPSKLVCGKCPPTMVYRFPRPIENDTGGAGTIGIGTDEVTCHLIYGTIDPPCLCEYDCGFIVGEIIVNNPTPPFWI